MSLFDSLKVTLADTAINPFISSPWDPQVEIPKLVERSKAQQSSPGSDALPGKVAILTGGSAGCGYAVLQGLSKACEHVYVFGRSHERNRAAIASLPAQDGAKVTSVTCDLSSLKSVRESASDFFRLEAARIKANADGKGVTPEVVVDIFIGNAGLISKTTKDVTQDGYEAMWGSNCLGHHALLHHLKAAFLRAAKLSLESETSPLYRPAPRIVITASGAHSALYSAEHNFYPFEQKMRSDLGKGLFMLYARSKAGNMVDQRGWIGHFTSDGQPGADRIVVTTVHPGGIRTEIAREHTGFLMSIAVRIANFFLWPREYGAVNMLWVALAAKDEEVHGKYVQPWCAVTRPTLMVQDERLVREHWEFQEGVVLAEARAAHSQ